MKFIATVLIGLFSISLIGCAAEAPLKSEESIQDKMSRLDTETKAIIGTASCSTSNQCHSIGFGDKPCGGFTSYRIYSEQGTNVALLKGKVAQYNTLSKQWNRKNGRISNCMMLMQPELNCHKQTCQIK